jgi:hypothetical protein
MTKHKRPTPREDARSEPKTNTDDVASLINERRKFEDWIAALEAKEAETPAHVFTRVHADYEKRLQAVVEKLAAHTSSLGNEVARLKKKLEKIDDEIANHQDERSEIELRSHAGELDTAELDDALREADEGLAQLTASRNAIEADLVRVTEFFAAATGAPAPSTTPKRLSRASFDELRFLQSVIGEEAEKKKPAETQSKPRFELEHEKEKPARAAPARPLERTAERRAPRPAEKPIEKVATQPIEKPVEAAARPPVEKPVEAVAPPPVEKPVEKAAAQPVEKPVERAAEKVVETAVAKPAAEKAPEPPVEPPVPAGGGTAIEKDTESLAAKPPQKDGRLSIVMQSMSQTIEPEDVPRNSIGIMKTDGSEPSLLAGLVSKEQEREQKREQKSEKPFAANVASNSPLSLKSAGKAGHKTLTCKECGAMNDPTEWYCERCGAELSAM